MRDNKNASSRRTVVLFLIAAACVLAFALVMGAGLAAAQAKESGALHTTAQAPSAQTAAAFDGLDVLVTATSGGVEDVLAPQEILPIAQEVAQRVFGRQFSEFVMLDCYKDESIPQDYVWRVYAYFGQNGAIDMLFNARTGQDVYCLDGTERRITPQDVRDMNQRAGPAWNAYKPVTPPGYTAKLPAAPAENEPWPGQTQAELELYQTLKKETLAFIAANKSDPEIDKARAFATEKGLLGDATIEDAWLLAREETGSPYGYAEFSTYEIKLSGGEWLVLGGRNDTGFFQYSRSEHSQLELYELEIQRLQPFSLGGEEA